MTILNVMKYFIKSLGKPTFWRLYFQYEWIF